MREEKLDRCIPRLVLDDIRWEACPPAPNALAAFLGMGHGIRDAQT